MREILDSAKANNVNTQEAFRTALFGLRGEAYGELITAMNEADEAGIERAARALARLGTSVSGAKTSLQRRFVRLAQKGEANFTELEWRSRILSPILRNIRTKAGLPRRRYTRKVSY